MDYTYKKAAVGGTFDRLHEGHKQLLIKAFSVAEHVVIGLTTNLFVQEKDLAHLILPYSERLKTLHTYLTEKGWTGRYDIIELSDIYGTVLHDDEIDVIVASKQTESGAKEVNQERQKLNKTSLPLVISNMVVDQNDEYLSSTRVRKGIVNLDGTVFDSVFASDIVITPEQREILKNPMDDLIEPPDITPADYTQIAVVGDESLKRFISLNVPFDFGVYDNMSQRQLITSEFRLESYGRFYSENPAGSITEESVIVIKQMIQAGEGVLEIEGEEDLLVLPMILLLPLGSLVCYGQPNKGIVGVLVTEKSKTKWYEFLKSG